MAIKVNSRSRLLNICLVKAENQMLPWNACYLLLQVTQREQSSPELFQHFLCPKIWIPQGSQVKTQYSKQKLAEETLQPLFLISACSPVRSLDLLNRQTQCEGWTTKARDVWRQATSIHLANYVASWILLIYIPLFCFSTDLEEVEA